MTISKLFDLSDVFLLSEIIDKMGIEADIENLTKTIQTTKLEDTSDATQLGKEVVIGLGADLITKIIRNLYKAQKEVLQFISNFTNLSIDEVSKLGFREIKSFFTQLSKQEGFESFLSQAGVSNGNE